MNRSLIKKAAMLAELTAKRKQAQWIGYKNLPALYECDFVSPYTKSAGNTSAKIFVMLQDWASEDALSGKPDPQTLALGYTPQLATNKNLQALLRTHFGVSISQIYATNLFPFIKPGGMSSRIHNLALRRAAKEFALPQIDIVGPRLVIALGLTCFNTIRDAIGKQRVYPLSAASEEPVDHLVSRIWCQAHTGWGARHRGSGAAVNRDWKRMALWFHGTA